jgi:phosphopantothenoylcysteine decarboxylase/phosphopantothenate--cysteine ligase
VLRRVILGLTGGIAAYKSAELARLLVKSGIEVQVVMTEAACRFITPVTLQALSGRPVYTDLWDVRPDNAMAHIDLSRGADAILVAPASADFLGKLANGLADDLLTTLCLARECPLLVAPAMNRQMWDSPPTRRNAERLAGDGVILLGPASGDQACGEVGEGRMLEPDEILASLVGWAQPKVLAGKRVVLTAGPTFEAIDPVRGLTNLSSGKMGFAIARAAAEAGADVTLIAGPTAQPTPLAVRRIDVRSAADMLRAVNSEIPGADVFVSVAAVADYTPAAPAQEKIKKQADPLTLHLAPTVDILASVAARTDPPYCVGFAAESTNMHDYAAEKRRRKRIPLLVGNVAQRAMGADDNEVTLFDDDGDEHLPRMPKLDLARRLVQEIAVRAERQRTRGKPERRPAPTGASSSSVPATPR